MPDCANEMLEFVEDSQRLWNCRFFFKKFLFMIPTKKGPPDLTCFLHNFRECVGMFSDRFQVIPVFSCIKKRALHPRNLTWNLKIMVFKRTFLFQGLIFRFHVKFRGFIKFLHNHPCKSASEVATTFLKKGVVPSKLPNLGKM